MSNRTGLEIAVIGMSGRFPGADNPGKFWDNLKKGVESISFFSDDELKRAGVSPLLIDNSKYVKAHGGLEGSECFDASFFGYSHSDAGIMDPQMRIAHECVWQALEDSGYVRETDSLSVGLYLGASPNFTWEVNVLASRFGSDSAEQFSGGIYKDKDFISTRISYGLGLTGPSFTMYSACSTSLLAVDLACRGILTGQCDIAAAGGVTVTSPPQRGYMFREGMMFSPDGHCRAFAAESAGCSFQEGAGIVVLKSLEKALVDRDYIYAVIKGTAVNNDGSRKVGYSAPGIKGQTDVIRTAQFMAQVEPESIGYIEAHGTGTRLGDPVELKALKNAFNTDKKGFCALGTVKTNVGHLDAAAGIAGLIKTILALRHRRIPPSLHYDSPNREIDFANSPFYVNRVLTEWDRSRYPLRAGVSSFGIGGTNVHVILEEAPPRDPSPGSRDYQLLMFSAKTAAALDKMTDNFRGYLAAERDMNLTDAAYTLKAGRKEFNHRRMIVCKDTREAEEILASPGSGKVKTFRIRSEDPPIVFMFPGLGSQYSNMGLDLYRSESFFKNEIDRCAGLFLPLTGFDLRSILYPRDDEPEQIKTIHHASAAHPVIFTFEYALARLMMEWGLEPGCMTGYSYGEYTAACLAGVIDLEDMVKLIALRGRLMETLPAGAMLSVPLPEQELLPLLNEEVSLAVDNGPSCIVSGSVAAVEAFADRLKEKGFMGMRVPTAHAAHSGMMEPILDEIESIVGKMKLSEPRIPYISCITGDWITGADAVDPGYWSRQLRSTVRFARGLDVIRENGEALFIEVGAGKGLSNLVRQKAGDKPGQMILNLIKNKEENVSDVYYLLERIGRLWLYGRRIDWRKFYGEEKRNRVPLPTYPFEKIAYPVGVDIIKLISNLSPAVVKTNDISRWTYLPSWKKSVLPEGENVRLSSNYDLLFIDDCGIGSALSEKLENNSQITIRVRRGDRYEQTGECSYTIDPGSEQDYMRLFRELADKNQAPGRMIHLWSISDDDEAKPLSFDRVRGLQVAGFYSLLYIAKATGHILPRLKTRLCIITNRVQAVNEIDNIDPGKATILGAVGVIPQEYVNISCLCIDIVLPARENVPQEILIERICEELAHETSDKYEVVAYRGLSRYERTMEQIDLSLPALKESPFKERGVYLLTGGLGGIGLVFSEFLSKNYKARLILTGRSVFPERSRWQEWLDKNGPDDKLSKKISILQDLEKAGAEILYLQVDISDPEEMARKVKEAETKFGNIDGIIHAAGVIDYGGVIHKRGREEDEACFAAKIYGTLVLNDMFNGKRLDFFVLCSSIGSLIPAFGEVGYAAGNAFLDAFADYKTVKEKVFTVSINWCFWHNVGMGEEVIKGRKGEGAGIEERSGIYPAEGVEILSRAVGNSFSRIAVSFVDLNKVMKVHKRFDERFKDSAGETAAGKSIDRPELLNEYVEPVTAVEKQLAALWQPFFGIEKIGIEDDFFELGGDSLKAMSMSGMIFRECNVEVPFVEFFTKSTIKDMAAYIDSSEKEDFVPVRNVEKKEYYPLSSAQKRLFILQEIDPLNINYNETRVIHLNEEIDKDKVKESVQGLIKRHESLRTSFRMLNEEPVQRIYDKVEAIIEYYEDGISDDGTRGPATPALDVTKGYSSQKKSSQENEILVHGNTGGEGSATPAHDVAKGYSSQKKSSQENEILVHGNTGGEGPAAKLAHFAGPFDLAGPPLLRVGIVSSGGKRYMIIFYLHHIIADGISQFILEREFLSNYRGEESSAPRLQYRDFVGWQYSEQRQLLVKKNAAYWIDQFSVEIPLLNLPIDYPRPVIRSFEGAVVSFVLNEDETGGLKGLSKENDATLYMSLLAIFNILLAKLAGQEEIIVGTPIAARSHIDIETMVGMFVNTLPLLNYPARDMTFKEFLADVKKRALAAFENQEYRFEDLVDSISVRRDTGRNPIFDVMFNLLSREEHALDISGFRKSSGYIHRDGTSKFDLNLLAADCDEMIYVDFEYSTKLFKPASIDLIIGYYKRIINRVISGPSVKIADIDILSGREKEQVLKEFNDTAAGYPVHKTIHRLFSEQVDRSPDSIAAVSKDDSVHGMCHISYNGLSEETARLSSLLKTKGVGPGVIAAIMPERSIGMLVGILGILKAGGAYLPIDTDYPQERVRYMLVDSGSELLLTQGDLLDVYGDICETTQIKDRVVDLMTPVSPDEPGESGDLVYVTYTSGSTGNPKGVMISHRSVVNFIKGITDVIEFKEDDRILSLTTICFDIFGLETLLPLTKGTRVVIGDREEQLNPEAAGFAMLNQDISIFQVTPSRLSLLVENRESSTALKLLKCLLVGGEAFPGPLLEKVREIVSSRIYNLYGPTETTIWSSIKDLSGGEDLNIGRPMCNTGIYILDRHNGLLPVGVAGDLYIGGDGLAGGYLNNIELTDKSFIEDPYMPGNKIYKTGDLGRWRADGHLDCLGRVDFQVKIRGFRVELGEIEKRIVEIDYIEEALVTAGGAAAADQYLCAYIVLKRARTLGRLTAPPLEGTSRETGADDGSIDGRDLENAIRNHLSDHLPGYMIPSYFVKLDAIPLTANGKINRKKLPSPEVAIGKDYAAPRNEMEGQLAAIWSAVLGIEKEIIGIDDNFFEIGGNSLKIIAVEKKINDTLKLDISVIELFTYSTIRLISDFAEKGRDEKVFVEDDRTEIMNTGKRKLKKKRERSMTDAAIRN